MKRFNDTWNGRDNLDFFVDVFLMADAEEKWPSLEETKMMLFKINQGNPKTETPEEEEPEEENIRKDELYGNRHLRYEKRRKANCRQAEVNMINKAHSRKAEGEGWCVSLNNPRGNFIRDLADKANAGDPRDRKRNRRAGKKLCRRYDIPEREIIPTVDDIDPEGTWDVESQEFFPDELELARRLSLREIEETSFPAIVTAVVDYEVSWGVDTEVYSLGLIESVEEGKAVVEKFIARFSDKGEIPYINIKSGPIKGVSYVGGAFYEEE